MSAVMDRLVADKVMGWSSASLGGNAWSPSTDMNALFQAVDAFTNNRAGSMRLQKCPNHVWEVTAWIKSGTRSSYDGTLPLAICRAMLAAMGVSVMSSDG